MKKYQAIYADPPWAFRTYSERGKGRSAENHYPTMSLTDIKALPVSEIADTNCVLFLWVTFPCLQEAFEVLNAWGFTYKTVAFVWVKQCKRSDGIFTGMGYWTRSNAEICLLATKGHPKRVARDVKQIVISHLQEHSKKPDEVRHRIEQLLGDVPRIELFARQHPEGWDVWGNEVVCSIDLPIQNGGEIFENRTTGCGFPQLPQPVPDEALRISQGGRPSGRAVDTPRTLRHRI